MHTVMQGTTGSMHRMYLDGKPAAEMRIVSRTPQALSC